MCKRDVINIQHADCSQVGPDCKKRSRASAACNWYSYAQSSRLRVSLTASAWRRRRAAGLFCANGVWRHEQNRKYVTYHYAARGGRASAIGNKHKQEAQLSPSDRAMRLVSSNLANYHATVQKLLLRQVLTESMVWSWRFSWRQCVINKPTTVELCISPL